MNGALLGSVILSILLGASCKESYYGSMLHRVGRLDANPEEESRKPDLMSHLGEVSVLEVMQTLSQAMKLFLEDESLALESGNISATCLQHLNTTWKSVTTEKWAQTMIDATGKIAPGLLLGNLFWTGQYDECVKVTATVKIANSSETTDLFKGRYCTIGIPLAPPAGGATLGQSAIPPTDISLGLCVPDSCDIDDLKNGINTLFSLLPYNWTHSGNVTTLSAKDGICQYEHLDYDARAAFSIAFMSILGALIVISTLYDMFVVHKIHRDLVVEVDADSQDTAPLIGHIPAENESLDIRNRGYGSTNGPITVRTDKKSPNIQESEEIGVCGRLLQCFSIYTNGPKLIDTRKQAGTLGAVHGIRFISMTWVILGHSIVFPATLTENIGTFVIQLINRLSFMAIANATVSVDTFFTLSGLLVGYLSLKEIKRVDGVKNFRWVMFYFHRFWRLTTPYMLVMLLYIPLTKYLYNGPFWAQHGIERNYCADSWWQNLLYINNFFPASKMCMAWSWYLANDMQFYVISPLLLIPLYYSKILGCLVSGTLLLACWIASGVISKQNGFSLSLISQTAADYFDLYYERPYCRIGPYIVGMLCGYILFKTDLKFRLSKKVQLLGWIVAAGTCLSVLYANFETINGKNPSSLEVQALYNALSRSAWAVGVCWVIFVCAIGQGGWVNSFLSWSAFIPLSRLTYMAYLIHPVIMTLYMTSRRHAFYLNDIELVYQYLPNLCLAYAVSFVLSLAFESPFMALEKVLFKRGKSS